MCRHNDLPWNIRKFVHSKLSNVNFSQDLREIEPWSLSKWSHTDIPRLVQGGLGGQVMEDVGWNLRFLGCEILRLPLKTYECFYVYLKIKSDKNEGDVVAKMSAHLSKSRVRFSTRWHPAVGPSARATAIRITEICNSAPSVCSNNIEIKKLPRKGHKNIVWLRGMRVSNSVNVGYIGNLGSFSRLSLNLWSANFRSCKLSI